MEKEVQPLRQSERTKTKLTRYVIDEYADVANVDHLAYQGSQTTEPCTLGEDCEYQSLLENQPGI